MYTLLITILVVTVVLGSATGALGRAVDRGKINPRMNRGLQSNVITMSMIVIGITIVIAGFNMIWWATIAWAVTLSVVWFVTGVLTNIIVSES